ncbi:LysM peptidoglycan-binding domain-containing protein [bacterium]|nr:LysM peptidoglycan-binding domain-containing protein [bacterium]
MNRIDNSGKGIAGLGRNEDSMLAHVAPGEMVVPPVISPQTQQIIQQEMMSAGLDPNEYTVGEGMSINPITGMAEFGFLKKLGKSLKKVVKKVAPIAGALLIPGVGGALSGALGGVGSAIGAGMSNVGLGGLASTLGNVGSSVLNAAGSIRGGIAGLTGLGGGQQQAGQTLQEGDTLYSISQATGVSVDDLMKANGISDPRALVIGDTIAIPGTGGSFTDFFRQKQSGQSGIGRIEDLIKGKSSDPVREGGGLLDGMNQSSGSGLNPAMLAMAALYGKAVKEDYKKKEGGMRDIRQSIRPDLMPQQTFQGFDLGVRKNAAMGGLQELDMRMGGPSVGPGTGTSDDIPAMLSDGEFVMTSAANNGLGGFKVTKTETGIEIMPSGKPSRQKGAKNMDKLMKVFENYNDIGAS